MPCLADLPDFLQPDFNPVATSKPRLRSILLEYNVKYSTAATKANLVVLFNQQVKPHVPALIDAALSVQPTTKGIRDAETGNQREERRLAEKRARERHQGRRTRSYVSSGESDVDNSVANVDEPNQSDEEDKSWAEARDAISDDDAASMAMSPRPPGYTNAVPNRYTSADPRRENESPSRPQPRVARPTTTNSAIEAPPRNLTQALGSLPGMSHYMNQLRAEVKRLNERLDANDEVVARLQSDNCDIRSHIDAVEKAIQMLE